MPLAGLGGYDLRMDAAPCPPLLKRVPPGGWMAVSWCAAVAYVFSSLVLTPPPGGPLWHREVLGLTIVRSNLGWPGVAMAGVVALSAILLSRWPLPALALLLGCAIAEAVAAAALQIASLLISPAAVAVGFIAATRPRRTSIAAGLIALGVLARYGTSWRGDGITADSWPAAVVIAWLIGQSIRRSRLHAETLRTQAEAGAVTAERLRIAGELHDMVAHCIGVIAIQAGAGSRIIGTQPAEARNALAVIEAASRETLASVRRTLGALRRAEPGHEPSHAPPGPVPARTAATSSPPLLRRVLPGVWTVASWCAVVAYAISAPVLAPAGFRVLTPRGPRLVPQHMTGLRLALDGLTAMPWPLLATAGVVLLSAVLLRRWPLSALALLLAGTVAAAIVPEPQIANLYLQLAVQPPTFFLVAPTCIAVGWIATTRPRPVSIGAAIIALGVQARCAAMGTPPGLAIGTSPLLAVAVATLIAWLIGYSIRQVRVHSEIVRARVQAQAVTAERLRIARDLHDTVAHSIGVIAIQAGMGSRVIDTQPAEARNALAAIEATSRDTMAGLRRTLGAPGGAGRGYPAPAPLDPVPGLADIGRLAATTMDAGVRVEVQWRGQRRPLPADIDQSAFRIVQEAVANVVRHAGTGHCQVIIDQQNDGVGIEVVDDGRGGAGDGTGYGITGMRERAGLLHGHLTAEPRPEGGFRVAARLPLPVPAGV
jgi:signal transduction histidine kinase